MKRNANIRLLTVMAVLTAVLATLFFLVAEVTMLYLTAYIFILVGIAGAWLSGWYLLKHIQSYPWAAAVPISGVAYLALNVVVSVILVLLEQLGLFTMPVGWLVIIQAILLGIYLIRILALDRARAVIDNRDAEIRDQVFNHKLLVADLQAILEKAPVEHRSELKRTLEALRYSDPIANDVVRGDDEGIRQSVDLLERAVDDGGEQEISRLSHELERQIHNRNMRLKAGK